MPDRYFLDTNIFLYSILEPKNDEETRKESIALAIIESQNIDIIISTQVINEISNCFLRKLNLLEIEYLKYLLKL
jgi:predicted nucleic acid-binding protein